MNSVTCRSLALGLGAGSSVGLALSAATAVAAAESVPPFEVRVELEETAFPCPAYQVTNNGSGMFWGSGNTQLVRLGDTLFASAFEAVPGCAPLNNARWALYQRDAAGWRLCQRDREDRTREPCPLGTSHSGRLFMSVNPTLAPWVDAAPDADQDGGAVPQRSTGGPARPEFLEFDATQPERPPQHLLPQWTGEPTFSEHSYRAFAADGETGACILFQNSGKSRSMWAYLSGDATWTTGELPWPKAEDPKYSVYRGEWTPVNYGQAILKGRQAHFTAQSPYNIWNRIDPSKTETWGRNNWGWRMRKLHYTWTPDVTTTPFAQWTVVDDTMDDGGTIGLGDSWLAPDGRLHIVWQKEPINAKLRDTHFPDIKRDWRMCYGILKDGKVLEKRDLFAGGETTGPLRPTGYIGHPRFHITPDHTMYVLCNLVGATPETRAQAGTYAIKIGANGADSVPVRIPLQRRITSTFFTATSRAGCPLSEEAHLLIADTVDGQPVARYVRIRFCASVSPSVSISGRAFSLPGEGREIKLTAAVSDPQDDVTTLRWRLPDGATRQGTSLNWTAPPAVGDRFTVVAEATDRAGHTNQASKTVSLPPQVLADADGLVVIEAEDFVAQGGGEARVCYPVNVDKASISYWHEDIGHWLEWDLDVPTAGRYELWMRYTTACTGTRRSLLLDGESPGPEFADIAVPTTGGWCTTEDTWAYLRLGPALQLSAGKRRLRMTNLADGLGVDCFILHRVK